MVPGRSPGLRSPFFSVPQECRQPRVMTAELPPALLAGSAAPTASWQRGSVTPLHKRKNKTKQNGPEPPGSTEPASGLSVHRGCRSDPKPRGPHPIPSPSPKPSDAPGTCGFKRLHDPLSRALVPNASASHVGPAGPGPNNSPSLFLLQHQPFDHQPGHGRKRE